MKQRGDMKHKSLYLLILVALTQACAVSQPSGLEPVSSGGLIGGESASGSEAQGGSPAGSAVSGGQVIGGSMDNPAGDTPGYTAGEVSVDVPGDGPVETG